MLGIFSWIWSGIQSFGQAVALPFLKVKSSSRLQAIFRWALHVLCVIGVLVGLWFINYTMRLDRVLLTPFPVLRNIWLPVLALQLYAISWVGWWLFQVMTAHQDVGNFSDLDNAWSKVESALAFASIDITRTPLFLMLGKPSNSTADFLNAGRVARKIPMAPSSEDAPFHVFANDEAVYVCLEDTSLLGRQSTLFQAVENHTNFSANKTTGSEIGKNFPIAPVSMAPAPLRSSEETAHPTPSRISAAASLETNPSQSEGGVATQVLPTTSPATDANSPGLRALALIESNIALLDMEEASLQTAQVAEPAVYQPKRKLKVPLLQDELEIETTTLRLKLSLIHI